MSETPAVGIYRGIGYVVGSDRIQMEMRTVLQAISLAAPMEHSFRRHALMVCLLEQISLCVSIAVGNLAVHLRRIVTTKGYDPYVYHIMCQYIMSQTPNTFNALNSAAVFVCS